MEDLAEESLAGLLSPLKEGERELEARGNALGVSLASGYVEGLEPSIPAKGRDNLAPQGRVASPEAAGQVNPAGVKYVLFVYWLSSNTIIG